MTQPYPTGDPQRVNQTALSEMAWIQGVVSGLRNIRGEMNIDPNRRIPALLQGGEATAQAYLERFHRLLIELARLESLEKIDADIQPPESAITLVGPMKVLVPLGSIIDRGVELKRLEREIEKLRNDLERSEKKLKNSSFIAKAPPNIVEKEQSRVESITHSIMELEKQRQRVDQL